MEFWEVLLTSLFYYNNKNLNNTLKETPVIKEIFKLVHASRKQTDCVLTNVKKYTKHKIEMLRRNSKNPAKSGVNPNAPDRSDPVPHVAAIVLPLLYKPADKSN